MDIYKQMAEKWPSSIVARTEVGRFSGGALNSKTMANLDCSGNGPKGAFKVGRRVVYPVESLIIFLREQSRG